MQSFTFPDVKAVMARANELKSGDNCLWWRLPTWNDAAKRVLPT